MFTTTRSDVLLETTGIWVYVADASSIVFTDAFGQGDTAWARRAECDQLIAEGEMFEWTTVLDRAFKLRFELAAARRNAPNSAFCEGGGFRRSRLRHSHSSGRTGAAAFACLE